MQIELCSPVQRPYVVSVISEPIHIISKSFLRVIRMIAKLQLSQVQSSLYDCNEVMYLLVVSTKNKFIKII